jgi:hypothetical protein
MSLSLFRFSGEDAGDENAPCHLLGTCDEHSSPLGRGHELSNEVFKLRREIATSTVGL